MQLYLITGAVVLGVIGFIIMLTREQRDKERRRREGLPPRKYHDITDANVTTVYTLRDK